jgi:ectoine hydroxylase-related dioxygenase (phytanoyl-CoA dioxygenase family)
MTTIPAHTIAADVRRNGFAVWPDFLPPSRRAALQRAAHDLAAGEHAHRYPKSTRVWDLYRHGQSFLDLLTAPNLVAVLTDLLGEHYLLSDYSLNMVGPNQPIDDWHIDYPYNEMPDLVYGGTLGLQCVLALDTFTEQNGATQIIPGSHIPPRRPSENLPAEPTSFLAKPGTLLVMAAATWHRSGANRSTHTRSAALLSFVERWIRPMCEPPEPGPWSANDDLRLLLGLQRPTETINGVPI